MVLRSSPSPQKTPEPTSSFKVYKELERIELSKSPKNGRQDSDNQFSSGEEQFNITGYQQLRARNEKMNINELYSFNNNQHLRNESGKGGAAYSNKSSSPLRQKVPIPMRQLQVVNVMQ